MDRILVVEDSDNEISEIVDAFQMYGIPKERIDIAKNTQDACKLIGDFSEGIKKYVAITLDWVLETGNSESLLKAIVKSGYKGYVVAASSDGEINDIMVCMGCTHKTPKLKFHVAKLVKDLLEGRNDLF